ncbi:hypothetical protein LZ31DRAFT_560191 [Colletotrichum somersetense]|nr:hypothetical protein LZ31DRAFT_560191 [Colletotrichum somersetense]
MSSTASLYVQYKKAERRASSKLFRGQRYVDWKLNQWRDHLPSHLDPETADEVIKNIEASIELREGVAERYAIVLKTPKDSSSHEYFVQFLHRLVLAVRRLPAGPTNNGHDQHCEHKAQTVDDHEDSLDDESLDETGPTNVVHDEPCGPQAQTIDTGDESLGDKSFDNLDLLMFLEAVDIFILEASENWWKVGRRERPLSAASIMSNMLATELHAFLAQAELLHPSWFESQDRDLWDMEDPPLNFQQLIELVVQCTLRLPYSQLCADRSRPIMLSGLSLQDSPVAIQHLLAAHKQCDNKPLRFIIWKRLVNESITAVSSSDVDNFRKIVQQRVNNMLRLTQDHQKMIEIPPGISETASMFLTWAQNTSDILSIGQIAEFTEVNSVTAYLMILELPSITMFAYLCEYIRIERNQSLDIVLEKWLDDTRLSKRLW